MYAFEIFLFATFYINIVWKITCLLLLSVVISMVATDVGDSLSWWQVWDLDYRFEILVNMFCSLLSDEEEFFIQVDDPTPNSFANKPSDFYNVEI